MIDLARVPLLDDRHSSTDVHVPAEADAPTAVLFPENPERPAFVAIAVERGAAVNHTSWEGGGVIGSFQAHRHARATLYLTPEQARELARSILAEVPEGESLVEQATRGGVPERRTA